MTPVKEISTGSAATIAAAVSEGKVSAREVTSAALDRIATVDGRVNSFTDVLSERALARAESLDAARRRGEAIGPLAGVPFAVKNLIGIAGLPTRAGSKINRERDPEQRDATLVARLETAGAILVGALNMGEYAYDFTGENVHDGSSRNPHALEHMSGGSSGGSAAAVSAGLVPLTVGSDTNGSIRVPSAFCGVFGLKPTYGRLSRTGSFPFVGSLDHLGPMARNTTDLALAYDAMQGPDLEDPHLVYRSHESALKHLHDGIGSLRLALADDYFERFADRDARAGLQRVADALGATKRVTIPEAARARAAAYLITASEGASLHLDRLRTRGADFDPAVRHRLLAGATIPANWIDRAQKFRRYYRDRVRALFEHVDVLLAPSVPCRAPKIGQATITLDGVAMPARANLGLFTQPFSFIGLPIVAVPVWIDAGLPLGVQIIAAPWREADAFRVARELERLKAVEAPISTLQGTRQ